MIRMLAVLAGLTATVLIFFSKLAAWLVYFLPLGYLLVNLSFMRRLRVTPNEGLSQEARNLISKYPFWYTYPNVAKDNGAAAATLAFFGVVLGIISYVRDYRIGLGIGALAAIAMVIVRRKADPIRYLKDEAQIRAHEEIVVFLRKGQTT